MIENIFLSQKGAKYLKTRLGDSIVKSIVKNEHYVDGPGYLLKNFARTLLTPAAENLSLKQSKNKAVEAFKRFKAK